MEVFYRQGFRIVVGLLTGLLLAAFVSATAFAANPSPSNTVKPEKATAKKTAHKPVPSKQIAGIQKALNQTGFTLKVDGYMGPKTRAALKTFQKKNGLKVTGKPDAPTLTKLGIKKT